RRAVPRAPILAYPSRRADSFPNPLRLEPRARRCEIFGRANVAPESAHVDRAYDEAVGDHLRDCTRHFELAARRRLQPRDILEDYLAGGEKARVVPSGRRGSGRGLFFEQLDHHLRSHINCTAAKWILD